MEFRRRLMVLSILAALFFLAFGTARFYSNPLVAYIVEHTLIEKAPDGTNPVQLRKRFRALLISEPDEKSRLEKLLSMARYLEKVPRLTKEELGKLLEDADEFGR